jgi:hypothetical protein
VDEEFDSEESSLAVAAGIVVVTPCLVVALLVEEEDISRVAKTAVHVAVAVQVAVADKLVSELLSWQSAWKVVVEAWLHEKMGPGTGAAVEAFHTRAVVVVVVAVVGIGGLHYCKPVVMVVALALAAWIHWHTFAFVHVLDSVAVVVEDDVPVWLRCRVRLVAWRVSERHVVVVVVVVVAVNVHGHWDDGGVEDFLHRFQAVVEVATTMT